MTPRAASAPAYTDWSRHRVNTDPKPCRICTEPAFMTDAAGKPCHKVCGEEELERHANYYADAR